MALPPSDPVALFGAEAVGELRSLRRAYARLLRIHGPETDPAGFQVVHAAFELARDALEREAPAQPAVAVAAASPARGGNGQSGDARLSQAADTIARAWSLPIEDFEAEIGRLEDISLGFTDDERGRLRRNLLIVRALRLAQADPAVPPRLAAFAQSVVGRLHRGETMAGAQALLRDLPNLTAELERLAPLHPALVGVVERAIELATERATAWDRGRPLDRPDARLDRQLLLLEAQLKDRLRRPPPKSGAGRAPRLLGIHRWMLSAFCFAGIGFGLLLFGVGAQLPGGVIWGVTAFLWLFMKDPDALLRGTEPSEKERFILHAEAARWGASILFELMRERGFWMHDLLARVEDPWLPLTQQAAAVLATDPWTDVRVYGAAHRARWSA